MAIGDRSPRPLGRWFATSVSNEIYIHRVADGALLGRLTAHYRQIDALVASPSGDALASGGLDGQVIVWDLRALRAKPDEVNADLQAASGFTVGSSGLVESNTAPQLLKPTRPNLKLGDRASEVRFDIHAYALADRQALLCNPSVVISRDGIEDRQSR